MYSKDDVELALLVVREGMSRREAAELVGCGEAAVRNWAADRLPRSCAPSSRIPGEGQPEGARMCPRGVYDPPATGPLAGLEPAQMENILLRAVLADLKAVGWGPGSISSRSKCELGERLRLESTPISFTPLRRLQAAIVLGPVGPLELLGAEVSQRREGELDRTRMTEPHGHRRARAGGAAYHGLRLVWCG